jgi:hypothetical protein
MAFHEKGFRSLPTPMGQPAQDSGPGETRQIHTFTTNDDRAAVETTGYFNALWTSPRRVKKGDLLDVVYAIASAPGHRRYVITIVANAVVLVPAGEDLGVLPRAVVATADGLTTGLILDTDTMVEIANGGNVNNWSTLPKATAATRGREIDIYCSAANSELRTPASSTDTINNVNCGAGASEALLTAGVLYKAIQATATGWLLTGLTNLGAVATPVVPD